MPFALRWPFLLSLLLAVPAARIAGADERTQVLSASGQARVGEASPWFGVMLAGRGQHVVNPTALAAKLAKEGRRAVAILFFGTWCKPCEVGLTHVVARRDALAQAGVDLLLVALLTEGEDPDGVAPWLGQRGLGDLPLVVDRFAQVAKPFGVDDELPRTVVLGADGRVKALLGSEGDDFVEQLLAASR